MAKSFYIERIRTHRLWSFRSIPWLVSLLGAIEWRPLWRLIGDISDVVFLGNAIKWFLSESRMGTLFLKYGWLLLVGMFLWLIFRASRRPPKQQYDIDGWDALQFILNDTIFGKDKTESLIEKYLKLAIEKGLIRLWAQPPGTARYEQVSAQKMSTMHLKLEPGGSRGQVYDEKGITFSEDYYFSPKFSIEELNAVFKSKGLLTRGAEWWLRRKYRKVAKIENMLRD